jgi:hypothetical protein
MPEDAIKAAIAEGKKAAALHSPRERKRAAPASMRKHSAGAGVMSASDSEYECVDGEAGGCAENVVKNRRVNETSANSADVNTTVSEYEEGSVAPWQTLNLDDVYSHEEQDQDAGWQ